MKLHEIQCHFREVPNAVTEYRLRRRPRPRARPYKILIHEDEHEDEYEKNQIRSHADALRPQSYTLYHVACMKLQFLFRSN